MLDAAKILEQFLGAGTGTGAGQAAPGQGKWGAAEGGSKGGLPGVGGFAGGAVAGGMLGLLLGSKKVRKMAGGIAGYGGAAAVGALAFKAYQNWQQGQSAATAPVAAPSDLANIDPRFLPATNTAAGNQLGLSMISAMIAAAKADGHIDADEQTRIFEQVEKLPLDGESKAFVFELLHKPVDLVSLCQNVEGIEQATEVYLAARLIADGDHPGERIFMQALAQRLQLPMELVAHLDHQVAGSQSL